MIGFDFGWTRYLIPQIDLPYDEQRYHFERMIFICKFICSDIGYSDMLVQFDDERKFEEAKRILSETDIKWMVRFEE